MEIERSCYTKTVLIAKNPISTNTLTAPVTVLMGRVGQREKGGGGGGGGGGS